MRLRDMKLKYKILLTNLMVLALVITVLIITSNQMFISYFVDETQKNLDREQQLIVQSLDTIFNSTEDYIRLAASDYNLQQSMKQLKEVRNTADYPISKIQVSTVMGEIMSNFIHPVTHIIGGAIIVDGEVIYSGYDISSVYVQQSLPEGFLTQVKDIERPVWSGLTKLEYAHSESKNVVLVGKSIIDKNTGEYLGECIFFVDEAIIASSFSSVKNLNSNLYITDYAYKIISCADNNNVGQNLSGVLNDNFETQTLNQSNVTFTGADKNVYSITDYPRMKWYIVDTASYETAAEKSSRTNFLIILAGLGCVCIYFLSSFLIDYTMIKPINSIANSMSKVGGGDLSIRETKRYSGEMRVIATNFNVLMDKIQSLIQEVYLQQKQHRENEFKILQAQINPHFLYNSMETIISFITLDMKKEATTAAMSLAEFYKLSLSKGKSIITVQDEIKLTLNYIQLQKLRYEDYFDFEVNVSKDLDYCYIPKLTLQPLVENAIYHGVKEGNRPGKIIINGYKQNDTAVLEVYDNGAGIDPRQIPQLLSEDRPQKTVFFGLANVDQRIKHKYGQQYGLHIESEKGRYTKVIVTLPINRSEAEA